MQHIPAKPRFPFSTKIALGIIIVVGIAAFLYYSPEDFSVNGFGNFGSGIGNIFSIATSSSVQGFDFYLQSSKSPLEQEVNIQNATVVAGGFHLTDTIVGDSAFENQGKTSEILLEGFNGKMSFKNETLFISGTATSASIDGYKLKPRTRNFDVSAQVQPTNYLIDPVSLLGIKILGTSGSVSKTGDNSTVRFAQADIEIVGFEGSLSGGSDLHSISGSAVEVKSKSFSLKS
jgi:hypothetical protein